MNPWLYYSLAALVVLAGVVCWLTNLIGAPGNWLLAGLVALFAWLAPATDGRGISWTTVGILVALAAAGEVLEFMAGAAGAAKQGASRRSVVYSLIGGFVGSLAGAMFGSPIPVFGSLAGALFGGSAGAFAGAYYGESTRQRSHGESFAVGKAAFWGRLWGTAGKFIVGAVMLGVLAVDAIM